MSALRKILHFARPHQKYIFVSLGFNLLYSALQVVSLMTILPVLGMLFGTIRATTDIRPPLVLEGGIDYWKRYAYYQIELLASQYGALPVLAWLCSITAVAFFLRNLFRYLGGLSLIHYRVGVTKDLRTEMYRKILSLPVAFFSEQRKGDMMSRMSNDVGEVEGSILGSLIELINAPFMILGTLVTLFLLSPQLTLFTLLVLPVMGGLISWTGKRLKKKSHTAQYEMGMIFSIVDETLKSTKILKIFPAGRIMEKRFGFSMQRWIDTSVSIGKIRELASPMSEFLGSVTFLLITFYGGREIILHKSIDPQDFLVFLAMFFQILPPAKTLSNAVSAVQKGEGALTRVMDILEADVRIYEIDNPKPILNIEKGIRFENVCFGYNEDALVLQNFSLNLEKGKTIALVGQSGSGKSTVANLLARFYDPISGRILIDGTDLRELQISDYRHLLGMVTQESVLFHDSIRNNLLMGKENATEEELIQALKIANAWDFVRVMPLGLDTGIGDDGGKLSGGQRQRLSIARAVLKNPPLMILDEATSALDTESEKLVQDALEKMMQGRTSLVIAHRLSTIRKADWIVVMNEGKMVEEGTHTSLYSKSGTYRKLVDLQTFED